MGVSEQRHRAGERKTMRKYFKIASSWLKGILSLVCKTLGGYFKWLSVTEENNLYTHEYLIIFHNFLCKGIYYHDNYFESE